MRRDLLLLSVTAVLLAADLAPFGAQAVAPGNGAGLYEIRYPGPDARPRPPKETTDRDSASEAPREGHVYKVGRGEEYDNPSDVAGRVRSGDTVQIAPGTYSDCAIWP